MPDTQPLFGLERAITPAFFRVNPVNIAGRSSKRLMMVLRTNGCAYDRLKKGCSMCDFAAHAVAGDLRVGAEHLLQQFDFVLRSVSIAGGQVEQIDLLTLGSFLHDGEVSCEARSALFGRIRELSDVRKVVIESRAEYVTREELRRLRELLRQDQILELGLGVETTDETLRNVVLNKSLSMHQVQRVMVSCADEGVTFQAYLLIKPPNLTEREAVEDAIRSASEIVQLARNAGVEHRIAFEPVFITDHTPLGLLYESGEYRLVNLWSVVEVILRTSHLGVRFVGLSDENLSSGLSARGCNVCTDELLSAIERFNGSQDLTELLAMHCECQEQNAAR